MKITSIKTRPFLPPRDDLFELLDAHLPALKEEDIVVITSKVLAIHQGRCKLIAEPHEKQELVQKEADYILKATKKIPYTLTIKGNTIIGGAGIDESNGNGFFILWPHRIPRAAKEIWTYLRKRHRVRALGVLITDSHFIPLRKGTLGIAIGLHGFEPVKNNIGNPDIFGRILRISRSDLADALAASAVFVMGEANEQTPFALIRGADVRFTNTATFRKLIVKPQGDSYSPLLKPLYDSKSKRTTRK